MAVEVEMGSVEQASGSACMGFCCCSRVGSAAASPRIGGYEASLCRRVPGPLKILRGWLTNGACLSFV